MDPREIVIDHYCCMIPRFKISEQYKSTFIYSETETFQISIMLSCIGICITNILRLLNSTLERPNLNCTTSALLRVHNTNSFDTCSPHILQNSFLFGIKSYAKYLLLKNYHHWRYKKNINVFSESTQGPIKAFLIQK